MTTLEEVEAFDTVTEEWVSLNEKWRLNSDGSRNLILESIYEKRAGRGKNAELSGEMGWEFRGYYGSNLDALGTGLNDKEFLESFAEVQRGQDILEALEEMKVFLNEREDRLKKLFKENLSTYVTDNLKNVKPPEEDKPMTMSAKKTKK